MVSIVLLTTFLYFGYSALDSAEQHKTALGDGECFRAPSMIKTCMYIYFQYSFQVGITRMLITHTHTHAHEAFPLQDSEIHLLIHLSLAPMMANYIC